MLFADAVHFVHNVHAGMVYARQGQRPAFACNSGRGRYSVLGGYSSITGAYVGVSLTGSVNAQTVIAFIKALEAAFPEAERITVYVDNARYFHARLVKAYLQARRVRFIYLPAYSPNLNLIERLWKFCKKKILSIYYAHFETFTRAVDAFFANLDRYREELDTLMTDHFEIFNGAKYKSLPASSPAPPFLASPHASPARTLLRHEPLAIIAHLQAQLRHARLLLLAG